MGKKRHSSTQGAASIGAKKAKKTGSKKSVFATCSVCHASVLVVTEGWVVYEHWLPDRTKCSGSGTKPYDGPPADHCAVCGAFTPVRAADGRITSHRAAGGRCEGSGNSPGKGRSAAFMNGTGVSRIVLVVLPDWEDVPRCTFMPSSSPSPPTLTGARVDRVA